MAPKQTYQLNTHVRYKSLQENREVVKLLVRYVRKKRVIYFEETVGSFYDVVLCKNEICL